MKDTATAIHEKAAELLAAHSEVTRLEEELKQAKERADTIATKEMPGLMENEDVSEFTTSAGVKFTLTESTFVNLKVENRGAFYKWCEDNGLSGIIKTTIEIPVSIGEVEKADQLIALLEKGVKLEDDDDEEKFQAGRTSKIESATLRKLARERIGAGEFWPEALAATTTIEVVKIKHPKKKK